MRKVTGAKLLAGTVVGLLLTVGLCSMGPPWEERGTNFQIAAAWAGILMFLASVIAFFVGLLGVVFGERDK